MSRCNADTGLSMENGPAVRCRLERDHDNPNDVENFLPVHRWWRGGRTWDERDFGIEWDDVPDVSPVSTEGARAKRGK